MTQEVATAPNDPDGHVNVSPKGGRDTFRIVDPATFAYLDLLGSGVETICHVRENGRIVIMFCAFDGPPKVLRLHGKGRMVQAHDDGFAEIVAGFDPSDDIVGILHSVILVDISRIGDSCGFVVPRMELVEERTHLVEYGEHRAKENGAGWGKSTFVPTTSRALTDVSGSISPIATTSSPMSKPGASPAPASHSSGKQGALSSRLVHLRTFWRSPESTSICHRTFWSTRQLGRACAHQRTSRRPAGLPACRPSL